MKGYIKNNNGTWYVKYSVHFKDQYRLSQFELPLHPEDSRAVAEYVKDIENLEDIIYNSSEIDFQIIDMQDGQKVAKLDKVFTL